MFYQAILETTRKLNPVKKQLFKTAIKTKRASLKSSCKYKSKRFDSLVFKKIKKALGGNVKFMVCGAAPISVEVLEFLKVAFCCPIIEVYGQTEGCGAEFTTSVEDPVGGFVGGPFPSVEYKLVDVPELNYFVTDKSASGKP